MVMISELNLWQCHLCGSGKTQITPNRGVHGEEQLYSSMSKIGGQGEGVTGTASEEEKCSKTLNGERRGEVLLKCHHSTVFH